LDRVSAQTPGFVARRLLAERVGLVFGLRQAPDDHEIGGLPELVEAAARSGAIDVARDALRRLTEMTLASGTDWALGI
jgi:hypothetical protein